jgi:hypothetical protein
MQKAQENKWDSSYIRVEQKWKKKNTKIKAKNEGFEQMSSYHNGGASYHDAIG